MNTFCSRLWTDIFIDEAGDVFFCCHPKTRPIGNVYNEPFNDIYNNHLAQEIRFTSLSGQLRCQKNCNLLTEKHIHNNNHTLVSNFNNLRKLQIQFSTICNVACIMCRQNHRYSKSLDIEAVIKNVDVKLFQRIEVQGGEPLLIKGMEIFFDHVISCGKEMSFLTNGTSLEQNMAEKIALHSAFIKFSINAATPETHELINRGSSWKRVIKNIKKLRQLKDHFQSSVSVEGHMTIIPQNIHEVSLFIDNYSDIGFEKIDFGYDWKTVPNLLSTNDSLRYQLETEIAQALSRTDQAKNNINISRLQHLHLVD